MTDNTPRPSEHSEPMTREQVLAVLALARTGCVMNADGREVPILVKIDKARAAIAALYERCEALERAVERKDEAMKAVAKYLGYQKFGAYVGTLQNAINFTGTEPSDAEMNQQEDRGIPMELSCVFGSLYSPRKPQRIKDPAQDAERILAAEQKRARKAARRAARNKV